MNLAAGLVIGGRLSGSEIALAAGAIIFVAAIGWVAWLVDRTWRRSVNRRFTVTATFYRAAGLSIITGAAIGGALGIGAVDSGAYLAHRSVHMTLNLLGWAGLTIVGTSLTLLPTILHVRAPNVGIVKPVPWFMFGGLVVFSAGATSRTDWMASAGILLYLIGLGTFATYVKTTLQVPRRRKVPTAALHLIAAATWALLTTMALVMTWAFGNGAASRDILVVGGAAGFVFQALLAAWAFLLPSTRPPLPDRRRRELVAMEVGGRLQVIAYNGGLIAVIVGLLTNVDSSLAGIVLAWSAASWALTKSWIFPSLAELSAVRARSDRWWAQVEK